jgi:NTE family protein
MPGFKQPDVLVLGGGGILGEAWMLAVLVGMQEESGFDPRECDAFVGTSAGSIVAAVLSAGIDPRDRLGRLPEQPAVGEDSPGSGNGGGARGRVTRLALQGARGAAAPFAAAGLRSTAPGGALFRRTLLGLAPTGRRSLRGLGDHLEREGARWDGRLQVSAVDVGNGKRVMFGASDAPEATVGQAVEASCAIPGVFEPIEIGGREYVDGGAWSPTNLDVAPVERGGRVLCLNPTGSLRGALAGPLGIVSRSAATVEAMALERRGVRVKIVAPDAASVEAFGGNLMNPRPRAAVVAAGLVQGRALGVRRS